MAEQELYDYLDIVAPDYDEFLDVAPQKIITEIVDKRQEVHEFDDENERVISYSDDIVAYLELQWIDYLDEADAGTILDFWADSSKANARARSFKLKHKGDGHTYVVKFREKFKRDWKAGFAQQHKLPVATLKLKVMGTIADA